MFSFYPSRRRRLGMESVAKRRHGITSKTCLASRVSVHLRRLDSIHPFGMIPYTAEPWFHTRLRRNSIPQQVADPIHVYGVIWMRKENDRAKNLLLEYSEQLACEVVKLCNEHKIDSNTVYQIKKSSSSVFANISEAQYPQSLADMLSKFEIARKECMETESWLKLIFSSGSIDEETFKKYRNLCGRIRRMLTSSCITIENKMKQGWKALWARQILPCW